MPQFPCRAFPAGFTGKGETKGCKRARESPLRPWWGEKGWRVQHPPVPLPPTPYPTTLPTTLPLPPTPYPTAPAPSPAPQHKHGDPTSPGSEGEGSEWGWGSRVGEEVNRVSGFGRGGGLRVPGARRGAWGGGPQ